MDFNSKNADVYPILQILGKHVGGIAECLCLVWNGKVQYVRVMFATVLILYVIMPDGPARFAPLTHQNTNKGWNLRTGEKGTAEMPKEEETLRMSWRVSIDIHSLPLHCS